MAEKSKVKSYARRTKKGVARVAGHARNSLKKKGLRADKKGLAITGGILGAGAIIGGAVALKKGAGKNLLSKHGKKVSRAMTNTSKTVGKAVKSVGSVANDFVEVGTQRAKSATQQAVQTAKRGGAIVKDGTRAIVPTKINSTALAVRGSTSKALATTGKKSNAALDSVLQPISRAAGKTYAAGKATRQALVDGYNNPGTGGAYQVGRNVFSGVKKAEDFAAGLIARAKKQRKTKS